MQQRIGHVTEEAEPNAVIKYMLQLNELLQEIYHSTFSTPVMTSQSLIVIIRLKTFN
jgi:hypothetical protein